VDRGERKAQRHRPGGASAAAPPLVVVVRQAAVRQVAVRQAEVRQGVEQGAVGPVRYSCL
jgi:hypothetical protein